MSDKLRMTQISRVAVIVLSSIVLFAYAAPWIALAQSADVHAAIRAEILKDPRTASMSEAEISAMVQALANSAEEEGIAREDIVAQSTSYTPIESAPAEVLACDGMPEFLCTINRSLGFDGSNLFIPVALVAAAGVLAFLLYELKHHIRVHGHTPLQ